MIKKFLPLFLSLFCLVARAQTVVVPDNIYFADQHLVITESARQLIQKQVDALLKYPTYFQAKVDRADTYFPIISRIFAEEGLPDDFKYLALQESGLVSDAISTSNAVGFWQFKKEAASDHGLLITSDVDERKHIVNSSHGAAKYFIKSNTLYYKNWFNTLLSYYLGFTGAKSYARPEHANSKQMEVNDKTNWYILTFLAHKVAFENFIGKNPNPPVVIQEVPATVGQSLSDIALATQTDYAEIQKYNKWLSGSVVPGNKPYTVLVPVTNPNQQQAILAANKNAPVSAPRTSEAFSSGPAVIKTVNGLKAIVARRGDTKEKLADAGRLSTKRFQQYNDLNSRAGITEGQIYYLERKNSKAPTAYYTVQAGEQPWHVAQKFGIKVKSVLWYNRLKKTESLLAGRVLWLQHRRPNHVPVEYQQTQPAEPAPQPATPSKPLIFAKTESAPAPEKKPTTASPTRPVPKNTVEDKLASIFGVKPDPEKVAQVDTKPLEIDENLADVNEEETEPVAVAPVQPNTPATAEPEPDQITDTTLSQVNEENAPVEVIQNIDPEVESINEPIETGTQPEPAQTAGTAAASEALYPARNKATTPVKTADASIFKSEPAAASKTTPTSIFKDPAKTAPVKNGAPTGNGNTVPVTATEHTVLKGETLYSISRLYGIPVDQLRAWNNLTGAPLAIGQTLQLAPPANSAKVKTPVKNEPVITAATIPAVTPRASTANAVTTQHVVTAGESMYQISRKYGVTIKDIMDWNNKADFSVTPGEKLTIKAKSSSRN